MSPCKVKNKKAWSKKQMDGETLVTQNGGSVGNEKHANQAKVGSGDILDAHLCRPQCFLRGGKDTAKSVDPLKPLRLTQPHLLLYGHSPSAEVLTR